MRLTLHTDYALRVLIYIAARTGDRARVRDISDAYGISHHHLTKVVQRLQRGGWVETARGRGGGLSLARAPATIPVGTVVRELERSDAFVSCMDRDGGCVIEPACGLKGALARAVEAYMAVLDGYTIADLAGARRRRALQELTGLKEIP